LANYSLARERGERGTPHDTRGKSGRECRSERKGKRLGERRDREREGGDTISKLGQFVVQSLQVLLEVVQAEQFLLVVFVQV
jgi:hypothetical protein